MAMYGNPSSVSMPPMGVMGSPMGFNTGPAGMMSGNTGSPMGFNTGTAGMMSGNTGMGQPNPGGMAQSNLEDGLNFTDQEVQHYQQLFAMADGDSQGLVTGPKAAAFLQRSGLPRAVLHQIWEIADAQRVGRLDAQGFFVALRLVGHVQANRAPSRDLVSIPPPALPDLPGVERRRGDSECSFPGESGPASISGNMSDFSDMQPVIASSRFNTAQMRSTQSTGGAETPPFQSGFASASRWCLSMRDKCKYARVFQRTDTDHDGFVEGTDARQLMQRSGLTTERLAEIWEYSDQDADGRLNFKEFLAMMHLITRQVKGEVAPPGQGLPQELAASIYSAPLESPEELAGMRTPPRSATASRSTSPVMNWASPQSHHAQGTDLSHPLDAQLGSPARSPKPPEAEPRMSGFTEPDAASGFEFGAFGAGSGDQFHAQKDDGNDDKKKKKEKKAKKDREKDADRSPEQPSGIFGDLVFNQGAAGERDRAMSGDVFAGVGGDRDAERRQSRERESGMQLSAMDDMPGFGSRHDETMEKRRASDAAQKDAQAVAVHLEAVIEADKMIAARIQREIDDLDEELRNIRDVREQMDRHMQTERREGDRGAEQRRELERQLQHAREQLKELREERRHVNLESISLRRDRDHFTEELSFLKTAYDEDTRNLEALQRANMYLEKSYQSLEAHTAQLERQRRETVQHADIEKDMFRQEERQNSEIKNKLERMKREKSLHSVERKEDALRERQLREMQGQWDSAPPSRGIHERNPPAFDTMDTRSNQPHSWAFSLGAPPENHAAPRDAGPSGSRNTGGTKFHAPMDRAGV